MAEDRRPLFIRLPIAQSHQLDAAARRLGRTKQDYVTAVLAASLVPGAVEGDPSPERPVTNGPERDDVLTLPELAQLLKIGEESVLARTLAGELPGRRFGDQWRFSRAAVLAWLDGSDADRRPYGFQSSTQAAPFPAPLPRRGRRGS